MVPVVRGLPKAWEMQGEDEAGVGWLPSALLTNTDFYALNQKYHQIRGLENAHWSFPS